MDIRIVSAGSESVPGMRNATAVEIARIKGDWERLAVVDVRADFHDYTSNYIQKALVQAYNRGVRDPRLLAVMGLFDCDLGNDSDARGYLEAAAAANVMGPRVSYELARIRYAESRPNDDSHLSESEVNHIIEPLEAGRLQSPPLREYYELATKVLAISDGALSAGQLALMNAGLRYFPRDLDLLYKVASLDEAHGHAAEAVALAGAGVELSSAAGDRMRFSALKTAATRKTAAP
jgi:hypothetical protein